MGDLLKGSEDSTLEQLNNFHEDLIIRYSECNVVIAEQVRKDALSYALLTILYSNAHYNDMEVFYKDKPPTTQAALDIARWTTALLLANTEEDYSLLAQEFRADSNLLYKEDPNLSNAFANIAAQLS